MNAIRTVDFLNPDQDLQHVDGTDEAPTLRVVPTTQVVEHDAGDDDDWSELGMEDLMALDDEDEEYFSLDAPPEILLDAIAKDLQVEERRSRLPRIGRKRVKLH